MESYAEESFTVELQCESHGKFLSLELMACQKKKDSGMRLAKIHVRIGVHLPGAEAKTDSTRSR